MPTVKRGDRKLPWVKKRAAFMGTVVMDDFYNSPSWRKFRHAYIRTHPLCAECERNGITKTAAVVDHITPINQGGDRWDDANLQPLCSQHHNAKSARDRWNKENV